MPFTQTPEFQSGILPFLIALVGAAVLRLVGGQRGWLPVALVLPIGFLATYWAVEGIAAFPPVASKQKVFYLAAGAGLAGLMLHLARAGAKTTIAVGIGWAVVALIWLSERQIAGADTTLIATLVALAAASGIVFATLTSAGRAPQPTGTESTGAASSGMGALQPGIALMVAAFAAGLISLQGAFIGMAQLSVAVGALLGGFLLVAWIIYLRRGATIPFGPLGVLGLGGSWLACVYVMVLFAGQVNVWALALLLATFLLVPLAARLPSARPGVVGRGLQTILFGAVVALPAIAAAIWVLATAAESSGY